MEYGDQKENTGVRLNRMKLKEVIGSLDLEVFYVSNPEGKTVSGGYVSDLLSDVMGNAEKNEVWITMQSHMNVVAIASLKELSAVIFVGGIEPAEAVVRKAEEEGIALLGTKLPTFSIAGRLYQLLER